MTFHDLNRAFDEFAPTHEQEQAMLDRLLTERKERKAVYHMKKVTAVIAAAALLLLACAFTVATGLDQRFLAYFRGTEGDAQAVSGGVVGVGQSLRYDNGWTIHIEQVLADRYSMAVLTEVIAPEGTVLDGEAYYFELGMVLPPSERNQAASSGWGYGLVILEDEDSGDNRPAHQGGAGDGGRDAAGTERNLASPVSAGERRQENKRGLFGRGAQLYRGLAGTGQRQDLGDQSAHPGGWGRMDAGGAVPVSHQPGLLAEQ